MAKTAQQDFNEYCDKFVIPRLQQMRKEERCKWIVKMVHESELETL
jgi:hypothetical protein